LHNLCSIFQALDEALQKTIKADNDATRKRAATHAMEVAVLQQELERLQTNGSSSTRDKSYTYFDDENFDDLAMLKQTYHILLKEKRKLEEENKEYKGILSEMNTVDFDQVMYDVNALIDRVAVLEG
jgi:hypothetical protein